MEQGWISIHRQIREHAFFKQKRKFSKFEAWIDLLLEANHCDKNWITGNEIIPVKRGSFITSELKLVDRWKWSKTKVRAFLKLLADEQMIVKKADNKKTAITIVNYEVYQKTETAEKPEKDFKKTSKRLQKDTTNNVNNVNNENKEVQYAEFVKMDEEEYQKLKDQHGEQSVKRMIEILDNYKGAKGKTYKSDYRAILNWVVKRHQEEGAGENGIGKHKEMDGRNKPSNRSGYEKDYKSGHEGFFE